MCVSHPEVFRILDPNQVPGIISAQRKLDFVTLYRQLTSIEGIYDIGSDFRCLTIDLDR